MIRKEVFNLATKLSEEAGFDVWTVYDFLMEVGRAKSKNPRLLRFKTANGYIWLDGEYFAFRLEHYRPREEVRVTNNAMGDYYYDLIMERQERYMD